MLSREGCAIVCHPNYLIVEYFVFGHILLAQQSYRPVSFLGLLPWDFLFFRRLRCAVCTYLCLLVSPVYGRKGELLNRVRIATLFFLGIKWLNVEIIFPSRLEVVVLSPVH